LHSNQKAPWQDLRTGFRRQLRKLAESAASSALQSRRVRGYAFDALHLLTDSASVTVDGVQYSFSTDDWIIGRSLYVNGCWDDEFMKTAVAFLDERSEGQPFSEGVFVDVGANIGTTTIQALDRFNARHAIAIEPSPQCLPYLYSNLAANRLSNRCDIIEAALSDVPGEVAFRIGENNSGAGEVIKETDGPDRIVSSQKLDDIILSLGVGLSELSLVWIDTEGHEYRVLNGAKNVIRAGIPIVIEFWPQRLRENGDLAPLVGLLVDDFKTIIDVRAQMQGTRECLIGNSVKAINAHAEALGSQLTDLLLLP
jgi:FkbM family methyltransferase